MKRIFRLNDALFLKLVALLLSLLLWGGVAASRHGAVKISVPLQVANLSSGLMIRGAVPQQLEVEVVGPRILLYQMQRKTLAVTLDFSGVAGGVVAFDHLGQDLELNPGIEVIRTVPGRLQVVVEAADGIQTLH
jgi:YbbR domain-containing protein